MNVILTNNEIYNYADSIIKNFSNQDLKLPIKINFYLQKNQLELLTLAQEIEKQRIDIIQEYGTLNEETQNYNVPNDKIDEVTKKINELFDLTQEVKIYKVKLKDFGNLELTSGQMQALLFMIEEEDEENNE